MAAKETYLPAFVDPHRLNRVTPTGGARYEIPSQAQVKLGVWVSGVGFSDQNNGYTRNRTLGTYAGVFIREKRLEFESLPTGKHVLPAGTLLWVFPDVIHSYGQIDGYFAEQWVLFGGTMINTLRAQGVLNPAKPWVNCAGNADVARLHEQLKQAFLNGGPLAVPLASAYVHQLIVLAHGLGTGLIGAKENLDPIVAQALPIIEREATQGLDPEALAERLHTGYSTLRRRFKAATGYAVKEYILRVQLRRAKELLAFSTDTVEAIAPACGFADPFYFSRLFKEREGVPPSVFRERRMLPPSEPVNG